MKSARIKLHIEELVLHGFAPGDRYRIAERLQQELGELLSAGELPRSLHESRDVPQIDAGAFPFQPGSRAESVGTQVAEAVYGALKDKPHP